MRLTRDEYALRLAETAALRSEDPKRQVGAAVLDADGHVLALGYNGPPPGIDLTDDEWASDMVKAGAVIHAEVNALRFVRPREAVLLASTYRPCAGCLKTAAAQGVTRVVYRDLPERAGEDSVSAGFARRRLGLELVQLAREETR